MKQRGRPATAALSLVPQALERIERLPPPEALNIEERQTWMSIVNGHPADWFDSGAIPTLTQLCRHAVIANRLAIMIDNVGNNATLLNLLVHQRNESMVIRTLSTSLRLTPQSLINHNANKKQAQVVNAPWSRTANAG